MGETAETLADRDHLTRAEQDAYAAESQHRCELARKAGLFREEIVPVRVPGARGETVVSDDEHPRDGVTAESLATLPPVFRAGGTVHAGSSSGLVEGATAGLDRRFHDSGRRPGGHGARAGPGGSRAS